MYKDSSALCSIDESIVFSIEFLVLFLIFHYSGLFSILFISGIPFKITLEIKMSLIDGNLSNFALNTFIVII